MMSDEKNHEATNLAERLIRVAPYPVQWGWRAGSGMEMGV